ncbi:MAG: thioesterase family protein [Oscillospiraceae bacterium]|nr:thioesterase family protein [Oscillospiraceae bacterium]
MEITVGMTGSVSTAVEREDTAYEVGSGSLLVYATPCMVALMEGAACEAIAPALSEEKTSVGIALNISHLSATPVGMEVRAEAEVTEVEGNTITFTVTAYDEKGKIGEGTHKRAIVTAQRFLEKTYAKL